MGTAAANGLGPSYMAARLHMGHRTTVALPSTRRSGSGLVHSRLCWMPLAIGLTLCGVAFAVDPANGLIRVPHVDGRAGFAALVADHDPSPASAISASSTLNASLASVLDSSFELVISRPVSPDSRMWRSSSVV